MSQNVTISPDKLDDWCMVDYPSKKPNDDNPINAAQITILNTTTQVSTNPFRNSSDLTEKKDPDIENLIPSSQGLKTFHAKVQTKNRININCGNLEEKITSCCIWFWTSCNKKKSPKD